MKLQLFFVLFFELLHCSFGNVAQEPDEFCDEGPPGKYCLEDLSGWHDCHVDPSTGKMADKVYSCPANTRCACFYGPACPGSLDDPCQPYQLPPTIPTVYTLYYNGKVTTCGPTGCHDTYLIGREVLNLTEHKKRDDFSYDQSIFVLPGNVSGFDQTTVSWDKKQCETEFIKTFPVTQIPPYYSYNGTVTLGHRLCEQWIWRTGGHNIGQPTSLSSYYLSNQTNAEKKRYAEVSGDDADPVVPVMIESFYNSGPVGKTSRHSVVNITSFLIGEVDEELLELPSFC